MLECASTERWRLCVTGLSLVQWRARVRLARSAPSVPHCASQPTVGRGDATVGNPHRAQISQFEFFELFLLLKLDNEVSIERFEPTASQSTVSSPPLRLGRLVRGLQVPLPLAALAADDSEARAN